MASNRFKIKQEWQEGGYRVVIDEHLDENSSNPVANWVLKQAIEQGGGGGGGGVWGTITGTITDQTDLIQYINAHGAGTWGAITGTLTDQTDLVQYINNALTNYYTKSQVYTKAETDALIPTVNDATLTVQKNGTTVDTFTANASTNKTINITVPTTAADVDALPDTTKYAASLTLSLNSTTYEMTATLKDQDGNTLGTAQTIDLPIESVVVSGRYDSTTKEVVLVLQSGSEIKFSVADLVSGLQPEITSTNKLDADLVDDSTSTNKFTTASDISKLAGIEANANNYVLPKATTSTLGGVKVGEHLEIDSDGVLETDEHVALYDDQDPESQVPLVKRADIDWSTFGQTDTPLSAWNARAVTPSILTGVEIPQKEGWGPSQHNDSSGTITIDGVNYSNRNTRIMGFWCGSDGVDANGCVVFEEIGVITYCDDSAMHGKMVKRYRHGSFSSGANGRNWSTINDHVGTTNRKRVGMGASGKAFTVTITPNGVTYPRGILRVNYTSNGGAEYFCYDVSYNGGPTSMSAYKYALTAGTAATVTQVTNGIKFTPSASGSAPYGVVMIETLNPDDEGLISISINTS